MPHYEADEPVQLLAKAGHGVMNVARDNDKRRLCPRPTESKKASEMSTTLASVTTAEPAADTPGLSAARATLARALRSRNDADAALSEAVKAQKAAEQLVGTPDKIRARIIELERKTAGAVEPWGTAGGVGQPTLPHAEELDELRRQLAEAERTADAARLSMPALNIKIRKARILSSDAIAAVRLAIVSVLADEAQSIIADIRRLDQESARCRALLEAAIRHLDRTMAHHRLPDAGIVVQRLQLSVPAHNGPTEASIAAAVPKWYEFSERFFAAEHGDLDERDLDAFGVRRLRTDVHGAE